uniref:Uncharacterized protein n=1 Tax=Rhizophora mucronata TaxID=61149 RepID=A0A2P2PUY0_RHIMU
MKRIYDFECYCENTRFYHHTISCLRPSFSSCQISCTVAYK